MSFIVGLLIFVLLANCLLLIFLVLVQLPKKDAGAGLAFGGGAADALFGAGSGNALTKITKYAVIVFFALTLLLSYLEVSMHGRGNASEFGKQVQEKQMQTPIATPPSVAPVSPATNNSTAWPLATSTNSPSMAPTNLPAK